MTSLKAPGFQKRALPLSVAAWHGMIRDNLAPARAELIRGVIIEKMSKSILHSKVSDYLAKYFHAAEASASRVPPPSESRRRKSTYR